MKKVVCAIICALALSTPAAESVAAAEASPAAAKSTAVTSGSPPTVLERFRTFTGKRDPNGLLRLFSSPDTAATVLQTPQVALSDGKSQVRLKVTMKMSEAAPNFAAEEARLVSVEHMSPDTWQIVLLPHPGAWSCSIIVQNGSAVTTIPVAVAPPLPVERDLSLKGFEQYLANRSAGYRPQFDLNDDGKLDYLDDYLFTANFLARKLADPHDPAARNQRARELTPVRPKP